MKYILVRDEYVNPGFSNGPLKMESFNGTFRELLEKLTDYNSWKEETGPQTDEQLQKLFDDGNGDGQDYITVFSVDEDKQVL